MLFSVGDEPPDVTSHRAWKIVESVSSLPRLLEGLPSGESLHKRVGKRREGTKVEIDTRADESLAILAISLKFIRFRASSFLLLTAVGIVNFIKRQRNTLSFYIFPLKGRYLYDYVANRFVTRIFIVSR